MVQKQTIARHDTSFVETGSQSVLTSWASLMNMARRIGPSSPGSRGGRGRESRREVGNLCAPIVLPASGAFRPVRIEARGKLYVVKGYLLL